MGHGWGPALSNRTDSGGLAGAEAGGPCPLEVVARAVQGIGGALLAPAALAVVTVTFVEARERAKAFSVFGAIGAVGGAVGLLLGGFLTEHANWRWTLFVNLGIAAVALAGTLGLIKRDAPSDRRPLDLIGTGLVSVGLFALVFGFSRAETDGWGATLTLSSLGISAILLTAFTWWQTRTRNPLLPLRILLDRGRGASLTALLVANAGVFAVFLFLTYYLQGTLGYSPVNSGLAFMPLIAGTIAGSVIGLNVLAPRIGPRVIVPAGMLVAAGSFLWLTDLGLHTAYWPGIFGPLLVLGLGLGFVYPLAINLSTGRLHDDDNGIASAAVNTTQQVGGSVGIALLSTLAATAAANFISSHQGAQATIAAEASLHSYAVAYRIAAVIYVVGAVAVAAIYRSGIPAEMKSSDALDPESGTQLAMSGETA